MKKNLMVALFGLGVLGATTSLQAAEVQPYTAERFAELSKVGSPVVVDVHADWCPTCRRQLPVLKQLVSAGKYQPYRVLIVDFDEQTDVRRQLKVAQQSTLIVFSGGTERARATGITTPEAIAAVLDKGLN